MTFKEASQFISLNHRHHKPPVGWKFGVGLFEGDDLVGVAVVSRPTARMSDNGVTAEVTRLCTDGSKNACSMLYGACWRAARAMGYKRLITYTLPDEGGSSLKASGWEFKGEAGGGSWSRENRKREDKHPLQVKWKWEKTG